VAEALAPVPDAVVTALRPAAWMPAAQVARAMARRLAPDEDADSPPRWLSPEQVGSFRQALHALRRYGGALLADPVGSGKTYVALAVAAVLDRGRPTACLVPATLVEQWRSTACTLGVEIVTGSHQSVSRGRLPDRRRGLVIVDEAHHFRNPATWRYRNAAPWLVGRPVLLVTATPVVNRLGDLLHQLLLGIRDDALAADGVASLRAILGRGCGSPALGRLVIEASCPSGLRPARRVVATAPDQAECQAAEASLASIDRLRLSRVPGTEALVRTLLRRAAASSPAALAGALRRYRNLLLHARDAAAAGRPLDRAALRRFTGELEDQLVWWELMPAGDDPNDLRLDDLDRIDQSLRETVSAEEQPDGKVERLRSLLADGRPTLVFTSRRETVRYLRDRVGPPPPAWCTGARAGVGHCPMPRASVLGWFRQPDQEYAPPHSRHLVVTDVAAEGLDLQRAARVIHYDLPWTPMRMEQREGRALRLGSLHREVEVVAFTPPPPIERSLRITRALATKARLPAVAGLGDPGRGLWRWRAELAEAYAAGEAALGTAVVSSGPPGVLAGFELYGVAPGAEERLASALVWIDPGGEWTEEERVVAARLAAAVHSGVAELAPDRLREALALIAAPIRSRLALARGSQWALPAAEPVAHRVSVRLHQGVRDAARRRELMTLAGLERALAFVGRGHTAGESLELERLAEMPDGQFYRKALRLPAPGIRWDTIEGRLGGCCCLCRADQSPGRRPSTERTPIGFSPPRNSKCSGESVREPLGRSRSGSRARRRSRCSARVAALNQMPGSMPGYRSAKSRRSLASRTLDSLIASTCQRPMMPWVGSIA
jgi:superfamily II DNA or RNA helicase